MKAKLISFVLLVAATFVFTGCPSKVEPENPDVEPPIEEPEEPNEPDKDITNEFYRFDLENNIMATLGTGTWGHMAFDGDKKYLSINVAEGSGTVANTINNGLSWREQTVKSGVTWNDIVFGGKTSTNAGKFVIVGISSEGKIVTAYLKSTGTWGITELNSGREPYIAYGNGKFCICYRNGSLLNIYYSTDGVTWAFQQTGHRYVDQLHGLAYGNGQFLLVTGSDSKPKIYASSDCLSWTIISTTGLFKSKLCRVTFGNGIYVMALKSTASPDPRSMISEDGKSWNDYFMGGSINNLTDINFCKDRFIATTSDMVFFSTDGKNWNKSNPITSSKIYGAYILQ